MLLTEISPEIAPFDYPVIYWVGGFCVWRTPYLLGMLSWIWITLILIVSSSLWSFKTGHPGFPYWAGYGLFYDKFTRFWLGRGNLATNSP